MRRRRQVFWDTLFVAILSWAIACYINYTDPEANLYLTKGLAWLGLFLIMPKALHRLPSGRPWTSGFSLPLMLLPLLVIFSRPGLSLNPLNTFLAVLEDPYIIWAVFFLLLCMFFFFVGCFTSLSGNEKHKTISWPLAFLTTFILAVLFGGLIYLIIFVL